MTNLLGLGVHRGQQVLGKQNRSSSVTLGTTSGTPSQCCPSSHHAHIQLSPRWGRQMWNSPVSVTAFSLPSSPTSDFYLPIKTVRQLPLHRQ